MKRILCATQDFGGINAVMPVVERLKKHKDIKIDVVINNSKYKRHKLIDDLSVENMLRLLTIYKPDVVLVGTGWKECIDKKIVLAAKILKIPTVSVHDYWSNYMERNSDQDLKISFIYTPDYMCVMDNYTKNTMIKLGFKNKNIIVTGQPNFDKLKKKHFPKKTKKDRTFLFVSQCFKEMYGDETRKTLGFDEFQVINEIYSGLERQFNNFNFTVALHPKDSPEKYGGFLADSKTDRYKLIQNSDAVFGMNSILLIEAAALGKQAISYMPGLKKPEYAKVNRINGIYTITKPPFKFRNKTKKKNSFGYAFNGKAAKNVESLILKILR